MKNFPRALEFGSKGPIRAQKGPMLHLEAPEEVSLQKCQILDHFSTCSSLLFSD